MFYGLGQQKITIDEMYNGTFRAKGMDELQSLKIQINTRS
jgi:dipeptidyl-peptidase-4